MRRTAAEQAGLAVEDVIAALNEGASVEIALAADPVPLPLSVQLWRHVIFEQRVSSEGRAIHIRGDAIELGEGAALWARLVDRRPDEVDRFVRNLLSHDGGRLAWFFDVVTHLDERRRRLVLGPGGGNQDWFERVYRVFVDLRPAWIVTERPFTRSVPDPALFLDPREMRISSVRADDNGTSSRRQGAG